MSGIIILGCSFTFSIEAGSVNQTEFTDMVSLTSQLALGVHSLKLQVGRHIGPAFTWVSSSAQAWAVST